MIKKLVRRKINKNKNLIIKVLIILKYIKLAIVQHKK